MTPSRLDEIKKLCEAATPGPWYVSPVYNPHGVALDECYVVAPFDEPSIADLGPLLGRDANFIAQSRTIIPELVAEVERLKRELDDLRLCRQQERESNKEHGTKEAVEAAYELWRSEMYEQ